MLQLPGSRFDTYPLLCSRIHIIHLALTQVPEFRAIFMLIGTIYGCVLDGEQFSGRVEVSCLMGGPGYIQLCGPRGTDLLPDSDWRQTYTMHRNYKTEMVQQYAGKFKALSVELGGAGGLGNTADRIAESWFARDVSLGQDQAAGFVRMVCKEMRRLTASTAEDGGPDHSKYQTGSMQQLVMAFAYESCKSSVGTQTCQVGFAQNAIDFSYETATCLKSQPECIRNRQVCLGRCDGAGGGVLSQDFATTFVKQELSVDAVGSDALLRGRANCSTHSRVFEVPLFPGGDAFALYSARLRVRGGFTGELRNEPVPYHSLLTFVCPCAQLLTLVHAPGSRWHVQRCSVCSNGSQR